MYLTALTIPELQIKKQNVQIINVDNTFFAVHSPHRLKWAKFDNSYLYSRLRDGNGYAARTVEPECLMPSK